MLWLFFSVELDVDTMRNWFWLLFNINFNIDTMRNWLRLDLHNSWNLYFLRSLFFRNLLGSAQQFLHHEFFHIELVLLHGRHSSKDRLSLLHWLHRLNN